MQAMPSLNSSPAYRIVFRISPFVINCFRVGIRSDSTTRWNYLISSPSSKLSSHSSQKTGTTRFEQHTIYARTFVSFGFLFSLVFHLRLRRLFRKTARHLIEYHAGFLFKRRFYYFYVHSKLNYLYKLKTPFHYASNTLLLSLNCDENDLMN